MKYRVKIECSCSGDYEADTSEAAVLAWARNHLGRAEIIYVRVDGELWAVGSRQGDIRAVAASDVAALRELCEWWAWAS